MTPVFDTCLADNEARGEADRNEAIWLIQRRSRWSKMGADGLRQQAILSPRRVELFVGCLVIESLLFFLVELCCVIID